MTKLYEVTCMRCVTKLAEYEQGAVGMAVCYGREETVRIYESASQSGPIKTPIEYGFKLPVIMVR